MAIDFCRWLLNSKQKCNFAYQNEVKTLIFISFFSIIALLGREE